MSTRWMAVQYVGDTLRIPVVNESDMDMPFGSSMLERDVRRIVVNPFSDSPQAFVPEAENAKLRTFIDLKETCWKYVGWCNECPYNGVDDEHDDRNCTVREKVNSLARELGIEVDR